MFPEGMVRRRILHVYNKDRPPWRIGKGFFYEQENFSAQQCQKKTHSRLSRKDVDQGRPRNREEAPGQGP